MAFSLKSYPPKRGAELVTQGQADGDTGRIYQFNQSGNYPNHVRVEEWISENAVTVFAVDSSMTLNDWETLEGKNYRVGYRRGIRNIGTKLSEVVESDNIVLFDTYEQGLKMLATGRIDMLLSGDNSLFIDKLLAKGRLDDVDVSSIKNLGALETIKVYPYLHKRHADLAPKLAETIREMKAEGLMEQYTIQAMQEYGLISGE
jgi:ABC-type amino acid transport substrate-binding protein